MGVRRSLFPKGLKALAKGCALTTLAAWSGLAAASPCRVTDFTDKPLLSLSEVQRLAVVTEMTGTEYGRLKSAAPGSPNYYKLIVDSHDISSARRVAHEKFATLKLDHVDEYRKIWASDFLDDNQLHEYADCITRRQPGLQTVGRFANPTTFNLIYSHITPVGVEKIPTTLIAAYNIANVREFEASLKDLGLVDSYSARSFALRIEDPNKRAVLVMRAGWETPVVVFIPTPQMSDSFK